MTISGRYELKDRKKKKTTFTTLMQQQSHIKSLNVSINKPFKYHVQNPTTK